MRRLVVFLITVMYLAETSLGTHNTCNPNATSQLTSVLHHDGPSLMVAMHMLMRTKNVQRWRLLPMTSQL